MPGLAEWAAMGGYAPFVWPAYAIATIILGGFCLYAWRRYRLSIELVGRLQGGRRG